MIYIGTVFVNELPKLVGMANQRSFWDMSFSRSSVPEAGSVDESQFQFMPLVFIDIAPHNARSVTVGWRWTFAFSTLGAPHLAKSIWPQWSL